MKYRYIIGSCNPSDSISKFRLETHRKINKISREVGCIVYRVKIPNDLVLKKSCTDYWTTEYSRTIEELGFDILMRMFDGNMKVMSNDIDLKAVQEEQMKKWQKSLYENYETAYHPYPKTQADIEFDKKIDREVIETLEKKNPKLANDMRDFYREKYGEEP